MKLTKLVPVITTDKLSEVKAFYLKYFGFSITFEHENYIGLKDAENTSIEMGFMAPAKGDPLFDGKGILLGIEVEDVDALYGLLREKGATFIKPIQDNPWGDRSFILQDPAGTSLYIFTPIPPAEEYKASVKD